MLEFIFIVYPFRLRLVDMRPKDFMNFLLFNVADSYSYGRRVFVLYLILILDETSSKEGKIGTN